MSLATVFGTKDSVEQAAKLENTNDPKHTNYRPSDVNSRG